MRHGHVASLAARLAAVVTLAGLCAAGVTAAHADDAAPGGSDLVTFGISPASAGRPDSRSFVALTAPPGSVVQDDIAVLNQSDVPLDLDVYATDAINDPNGSISLPDRADAPRLAGSWLTLGAPSAHVPAQSSTDGIGFVDVPVTITIPVDAEPGDHVAAVVAALTVQGDGAADSPAIKLEQRTGARIYITVDGPTKAGVTVSDVHAVYQQADVAGLAGLGSMRVSYTLTNSGNLRIGVAPTVQASGPFGALARSADGVTIDELLPGASVEQVVTVPGVAPLLLDSVSVSATALAVPGRDAPGIAPAHASTFTWAVPWAFLALLALLVGGGLLLRHRRRSARTPPPASPSTPEPAVSTTPVVETVR